MQDINFHLKSRELAENHVILTDFKKKASANVKPFHLYYKQRFERIDMKFYTLVFKKDLTLRFETISTYDMILLNLTVKCRFNHNMVYGYLG